MTRCEDNGCDCHAGCQRYIRPEEKTAETPVYHRSPRRFEIQSRCEEFLRKETA